MQLLVELSCEYPSLPQSEFTACLEANSITHTLLSANKRLLVVDLGKLEGEEIKQLSERLSLSFTISKLLKATRITTEHALHDILSTARDIDLPAGSFRVRARIYDKQCITEKSDELEKKIGELWPNHPVNLSNPASELRVVVSGGVAHLGLKLTSIDRSQYERRKPQFRPFFSPISLHPRLARALVNLTQIREGEKLLDPFCGTGGFLVEGGLIGAKVFGSDIQEKMVDGCKKNLNHYGIKDYEIECKDVGGINFSSMDGVVTDFPYGRASKSVGERHLLFNKAFQSIRHSMKDGGISVTGLPDRESVELGKKHLKLQAIYPCYVHKNLTRHFAVWKK